MFKEQFGHTTHDYGWNDFDYLEVDQLAMKFNLFGDNCSNVYTKHSTDTAFMTENEVKLKGNTQNKVQTIKWFCGLYDGCNDQRAYWIWLTAIILQACLCVFSPLKIEIWQSGESKAENHVSIYCYIFLVLWSSSIFR